MNSFNKVDRLRAKSRELRTLSDPQSTQEERHLALESLDAMRRQRPDYAYRNDDNGMNLMPDQSRPSVEDDMNRRVTNKHGHEVYAPGYQEFSDVEVQAHPRVFRASGNVSSFPGFRSETGERVQDYAQKVAPHMWIKQNLNREQVQYVDNVVHALNRQVSGQELQPKVVFERFERTTSDISQEQLYLVAHGMKLLGEKYESTAGKWVVTMPYANPMTPEQILYNQKGISNVTQKDLQKNQVGNYWLGADAAYDAVYKPQMPAAKPVPGEERSRYYAGKDVKSQMSLRNPKRGDDFIRDTRIKAAMDEEDKRFLLQSRKESEWLLEAIEKTPHEYEKKKYRKRLKAIKNQAISRRANRREREKNRTEYAGQLNAVDRSAGALDKMMNPREADEQRREEANYARHLSLLESANRILRQPNSKFIAE